VFISRDREVERQLRAGTHVFKLGRAVAVTGLVVDSQGNPVPDADIVVGVISESGNRTGKVAADGTFSVGGCTPGRQLVTAQAPGFAPTTLKVEVTGNSNPTLIVLSPGKVLRLRVTDASGNPIPKVRLWYDCINGFSSESTNVLVQLEYNPTAGPDGRAVLTNAPDTEMCLNASADGFLGRSDIVVRPDGQEHVISLQRALVVHGEVRDDATGERVPKFRVAQGWTEVNPVENRTNIQWSTIGRFWLDFSGGTFTHTFEEEVLGRAENPSYVLKFMAEGYAPYVSRMIDAGEGDVTLNVALHRAAATKVRVLNPDGRVAAFADIGLASSGARLRLARGGFSRENFRSGGALLQTDAQGTFVLAADDSISRVIAAGPTGYGEAAPAALAANPILQLQPWGRLELTCYSGGKPVAGRQFGVSFSDVPRETLGYEFDASRMTTGDDGKMILDSLPPGNLGLLHHIANDHGWSERPETSFEIKAGETTSLTLGLSNHMVAARLVWPAGLRREPNWQVSGNLHAPMPAIAPEIRTNPAALRSLYASEGFKSARQKVKFYQVTDQDGDSVVVEDVPSGSYSLEVWVWVKPDGPATESANGSSQPPPEVAHGRISVTVPTDVPGGTVDAGLVEMKATAPKH